ncbi:hypothetical protein HO173_010781 [Letharia columbiana]|uniref:Uncharacterized protein n=1 Tax=Letharia columbiana TaxID=112416 RepID=A0A8H6FM52_9LECA|nr:uncharacterized protein HO173_010781 [Letharia columbiana]KAF6231081.1 hypothetical protein HO173_010781 [Letharia columbiana]
MNTSASYLQVPARGRGHALGFRIVILVLDIVTIVALSISLGLYHKWIPSTSYPTTALKPSKHTDWTDPIVLAAVLVSFTWTSFITIRPAWTSKALHLGYYVAFEVICLVWLLACTIPALTLRESGFKDLVAISNTCDMGSVTLMNGDKVPWVCMPHLNTLKKLQVATYSVACAVAVLHFTLFALACHSTTHLPQASTPSHSIENTPNQQTIAPETQDPTTRGKLSAADSGIVRFLHCGEVAVLERRPLPRPHSSVPSPLACRPGAFVTTLAAFRDSAYEASLS